VGAGTEETPAMIRGLGPLCWESWGWSARRREDSGESLEQLPVPEGPCKRAGEGLVTRTWSGRTRGHGFKLKEGRLRLDIRNKFFPMRVARPWPRLPREAVAVPSLAVFKARLDNALSNLVWWQGFLPTARGVGTGYLHWMSSRSLPTETIL